MTAEKKLELIIEEIEAELERDYEIKAKAIEEDDEWRNNYISGAINCLRRLRFIIKNLY